MPKTKVKSSHGKHGGRKSTNRRKHYIRRRGIRKYYLRNTYNLRDGPCPVNGPTPTNVEVDVPKKKVRIQRRKLKKCTQTDSINFTTENTPDGLAVAFFLGKQWSIEYQGPGKFLVMKTGTEREESDPMPSTSRANPLSRQQTSATQTVQVPRRYVARRAPPPNHYAAMAKRVNVETEERVFNVMNDNDDNDSLFDIETLEDTGEGWLQNNYVKPSVMKLWKEH